MRFSGKNTLKKIVIPRSLITKLQILNFKPQTPTHKLQTISYFCCMTGLKFFLGMICVIGCVFTGMAQADTTSKTETTRKQPVIIPLKKQLAKPVIADSAERHFADSVLLADSLQTAQKVADSLNADSLKKVVLPKVPVVVYDTSTYKKFQTHPYLPLYKQAVYMVIDYRKPSSKDELFYLMAGVFLLLAFIRVAFSKYFRNIFLLFFQTSIRQKQTRDQLLQDNLASLLTNFLFVISAGLYITLLIRYKNLSNLNFWWLAGGTALVLLITYLIKYLFILFTGWVFNSGEAAGSYVFVVFMVNKVMGVLLIPFLLILSFSGPQMVSVAITVSVGMILLLFGYRYWVSFIAIRNKLKVNALHFFLYLCAVELLPLVLIYKILINYFTGSL